MGKQALRGGAAVERVDGWEAKIRDGRPAPFNHAGQREDMGQLAGPVGLSVESKASHNQKRPVTRTQRGDTSGTKAADRS